MQTSVCLLFLFVLFGSVWGRDKDISVSDIISAKYKLGELLHRVEWESYLAEALGTDLSVRSKIDPIIERSNLFHLENNLDEVEDISRNIQRIEEELLYNLQDVVDSREITTNNPNCSIFAGYNLTETYVCESPVSFIFELLGDGRDSSMALFVNIFTQLDLNVTSNEKDIFLLQVMKLLVNQTLTNPPQYVSHGTDHSVRVMQWAYDLFAVPQIADGMYYNYETSELQSRFILALLGLLHDIGYADLASHAVPKWLHSISSGKLVELLLNQETGNIGIRILQGAAPNHTEIVDHFVTAIATHNFDDSFCRWTINNPLYASQCTFKTSGNPADPKSATTPLLNRTEPYARGYTTGHAQYSPLTFSVRVADNLDAVRTRLTPVQNSAPLMSYFLRMYSDAELRNAVAKNSDDLDSVRGKAMARARSYAGLENANGTLRNVMDKASEQSWLHFYSNWIIKSSNIDSETWSIDVYLWNASAPLDFGSHPGPGLYQVNRLATSALSCHIDNQTTFLDLVRFNFDIPIQGLDNGNYLPLKAFTKKPIYTETGPAYWSDNNSNEICDPYCSSMTVSLTISPEPCLDNNNQVTTDCNIEGFSQVPPFTDLTYNVPVQSDKATKDKTEIILISVFGSIGIVLLLGTIIALILVKRKSHSGYEQIK